jgi:hypothetical protein
MVGAAKCCGVEVFLRGCSLWERRVIVGVRVQKLLALACCRVGLVSPGIQRYAKNRLVQPKYRG